MSTHKSSGGGVVVLIVGLLLVGGHQSHSPDQPHGSTGHGTERSTDTGNGTPFPHDPNKAQMYRDLTRPLPYRGGNENSRCGAWAAGTDKDARQMRAIHQRCLKQG